MNESFAEIGILGPALLVLPATSVCRTCTLLFPSAAVKMLPQVVPPSIEYSTVAPASMPVKVRLPVRLIRSVPLAPVSLLRDTPGVAAIVSSTKVRLPLAVLPATSVSRTVTVWLPSVPGAL